jgi:hypothetical protein
MHWREGWFRLFISYASQERELANRLRRELEPYHVDCFVAPDAIPPLDQWLPALRSALYEVHAVVALVTPTFSASQWCNQEVGLALGSGKAVAAVSVGAAPPGFLSNLQAIAGLDRPFAQLAEEILRTLATHDASRDTIAESLALRIASCNFVDAGLLQKQLRWITWTPQTALALQRAVLRNPRLQGTSFSDAIDAILASHRG